jgi:hypothetical protein
MASQRRTASTPPRGVRVQDVRRLLLGLPNVLEGRSYGMPSFLLNGRFLARFRDDDTVLVLQLATIAEREVLMQLEPQAFFFTEHYRNYPAVLIRFSGSSALAPGRRCGSVVGPCRGNATSTAAAQTRASPKAPSPRVAAPAMITSASQEAGA